MDFQTVTQNLERRGFSVRTFATAADAAHAIDAEIDGKTVGFGGSVTLRELGLYDLLRRHNEVFWHMQTGDFATCRDAAAAQIYLTSANGLAETGELINIDGIGNRISATLYGHEAVYFVIGRNKLAPDYDAALWRARNIAAPKNAQRKQVHTPCAAKADRCYDCSSPERICQGLAVLWGAPLGMTVKVLLIDEDLGY